MLCQTIVKDDLKHKSRHPSAALVLSAAMQTAVKPPREDYYTRAANDDCIKGGSRTRTKYSLCPGPARQRPRACHRQWYGRDAIRLRSVRQPHYAVASDIGYAGYFYHAASGLEFTLNRAYDPVHARWLNRDPIREVGGINLYAYAGGDPMDYTDPLGLCGDPDSQLQEITITAPYEGPPPVTAPTDLLPLPLDDYTGLENALETAVDSLDGQLAGQLVLHALAAYTNMNGTTTRMPKPPAPATPEEQTTEQPYNPPNSVTETELQLEEQEIMGKPVGSGLPAGESPAPEDPFIDF